MTFEDLLIHDCTIQRKAEIGRDDLNNPVYGYEIMGNEKVRLEEQDAKEVRGEKDIIITKDLVFASKSSNILERDRMIINGHQYYVCLVNKLYGLKSLHHLEIDVELIK